MAGSLSGRIMGSYSGGTTYQPYLSWSISQSIANNRSTMSVTFGMYKAKANSQSYNINSRTITIVVNGATYSRSAGFDFRNAAVGSYNDMFTISNINISHNADGSKSVSMSATHSTGISLGTGTVSGTAVLLDIPRATTPSLSDSIVNLGDTITITTSAASSSFRHTLRYKFGSMTGTIASKVASSVKWTIPKNFANVITTTNRGAGEVICETFNGSTSLGTKSVPFTAFIPDTAEFRPSIEASDITVSDTNSALYSKFGGHVQNKSRLNISVSGVATAYGSAITRYEISVSGKSYIGSQVTTDTLTQSGTLAVSCTVTDSRGRTSSASKNITVYPYTAPQITAYTVYRSNASGEADESGEYATLYMAYSIASVDGKNDRQYRILYKRSTDESYTTAESGTAQTSYEGIHTLSGVTFSIDYQWDIRLEIWDYFTSSNHIAWTQTLDTEEVILDFNSSGKGFAIGKVSEQDGFEIAWDAYFLGNINFGTGAGAHNCIYRGRFLGNAVTEAQYDAIESGQFTGLYIGDYWTIGGRNYRIAAFDYYYNTGDTAFTQHHAVIVPDTSLYTYAMNDNATTSGGYAGSKMRTEGLEQAKTIVKAAFPNHVLSHRIYLTNAVTNGSPSNVGWYDSEVDLMNEQMVYGGPIHMSFATGNMNNANSRIEKSQLPLFVYEPNRGCNRSSWWLRDVASAAFFSIVSYTGRSGCDNANQTYGVRPAFCIG